MKYRLLMLIFLVAIYSCKDNDKQKEIAKIVTEWTGKEILFPENTPKTFH